MANRMTTSVRIASTGAYLPARRLDNHELSRQVDTSHDWIVSHTGISCRHVAADEESTADLAVRAGRVALEQAGVAPEDLGMIIVATSTADYGGMPSTACLVQHRLGAVNAGAFDVTAACSGFVYALEVGRGLAAAGGRPVLVIGSEIMTRILNWQDRNTCVLFGDGAGAVVLETHQDGFPGIEYSYLRADGSGSGVLYREGGCRLPLEQMRSLDWHLVMKGRPVFNFAVRAMVDVIEHLAAKARLSPEDIEHIVPHQANVRIIQAAAKRLNIPEDRFYLNIGEVANTSAASIPIALHEMNGKNILKRGDRVIVVAFGSGLTYGGNLLYW